MANKKILYVRSAPYLLSFSNYNLQEVGLGKAFCRKGHDFDILYYAKENLDQMVPCEGGKLRILWRKGLKVLRTGLYPSILNKAFLQQYDTVIMSEYNQFMSVLVTSMHKNVYLYNGPYYNMFILPFMEPVYAKLFCRQLNGKMKKVFCKTKMAAEYIREKGITNTAVVGVGLDPEKFEAETQINEQTKALLSRMENHRNLLYVGSISQRKNVALLLKAFALLKQQPEYRDVQLVLVGKGSDSYFTQCKALVDPAWEQDVVFCSFIENAQLKFIYKQADIFLLPSLEEIFGMVLLEAMYFGTPTVASHTAGSETLICNGETGIIVEDFEPDSWANVLADLLSDPQKTARLGKNAEQSIREHFMWDGIAEKMLAYMN